ncbi:ABC transporter substrate-binding protein [Sphingobacterium multivorum]|uniref:ABC transporter substrate-binding protein n=1 Tax=Sphingobacterium multivorum TaxID=28454 RepID=A0ABX7CIB8_SPHMU|nr:ABC transporter substrate-binding protein [Sphingobacterium multivorum]QQT32270.1 ABC transporter substrate-binding protein [Sphingobacterium multivorum]QQT51812.1 ABC transporter substrate-binding protein [Sphingobacterium multivorum]
MHIVRIILMLFLPIWIGCEGSKTNGHRSASGITVIDAQEHTISLNKVAERIVCLYEPGLDALYMLQAESKLVGLFSDVYESNDLFPFYAKMDRRIEKKELPIVGAGNQANVESVVALNPDLVIVHAGQESLVNALRNAGLQVYAVKAELQGEVFKTIQDISILTGTEARGLELRQYVVAEIDRLKEGAAAVKEKRRVYFTWAYGRIFSTTGTNSMMHTCLEMAGVQNVCPFELDQPNINAETLIGWNPDMIVMWNDSPDLFYQRHEFNTIHAVKEKQIFNLLPMFIYNPHTLKALCTATAIHHWAYFTAEFNHKQRIVEVISRLYGKEKADRMINLL